LKILIDFYRNT